MTAIERQILLNQIAILEALVPTLPAVAGGTRELLQLRYRQTAQLIREQSTSQGG